MHTFTNENIRKLYGFLFSGVEKGFNGNKSVNRSCLFLPNIEILASSVINLGKMWNFTVIYHDMSNGTWVLLAKHLFTNYRKTQKVGSHKIWKIQVNLKAATYGNPKIKLIKNKKKFPIPETQCKKLDVELVQMYAILLKFLCFTFFVGLQSIEIPSF